MRGSYRGLPIAVVPALVAVAILGYIVGHARSQGASAETMRTAFAANVVLDYPSGWRPATGAPGIPGPVVPVAVLQRVT